MGQVLNEWIALSMYTVFMGFCFCDGFKLSIIEKLVWFGGYLAVCFYSFFSYQHFDLVVIVSVGSVLAFLICGYHVVCQKNNP